MRLNLSTSILGTAEALSTHVFVYAMHRNGDTASLKKPLAYHVRVLRVRGGHLGGCRRGNGNYPSQCGATLAGWTLIVRIQCFARLDRRALKVFGV